MKNKFIYIHGYGSSHHSLKSVRLQEYFREYDFGWMDWTVADDISRLLDDLENSLADFDNPIVYGDSTGANFAYQLRERRKSNGKDTILILSSPLLINRLKISIEDIPQFFQNQLKEYFTPENALIIASPEDETLDLAWLWEKKLEKVELVSVDDCHELHRFPEYLPVMKNYIERFL